MARSPQEIAALEKLCDLLKNDELVFQLEASEKLTTATGEGDAAAIYKVIMINGGQEFVFDRARVGKKGQMIFCFKPMDKQVFNYIEIDEKKVFETFPSAVDLFGGIEGFDRSFLNHGAPSGAFPTYVSSWMANLIREAELREIAAAEAAAAAQRAEMAVYESNPLFGAF